MYEETGQASALLRLIGQGEMIRMLGGIPVIQMSTSDYAANRYAACSDRRPPLHARDVQHDGPDGFRSDAGGGGRGWALVPNAPLIGDAVASGRGPELIARWEELVLTAPWSTLPAAYGAAYEDQPGGVLATRHRAMAMSGGFDIVPAARAALVRDRLLAACRLRDCVDREL